MSDTESIEAAVFRRLIQHLQERSDVQNIDLMLLADFCRNCLSKWYREAAQDAGVTLSEAEAKEQVYGMPYSQWKKEHQLPVPPEKLARFEANQAKRNG